MALKVEPGLSGGDPKSSRRAVSVNTIKNRIFGGDQSTAFPYMYIKGLEDVKSALLGFTSY